MNAARFHNSGGLSNVQNREIHEISSAGLCSYLQYIDQLGIAGDCRLYICRHHINEPGP